MFASSSGSIPETECTSSAVFTPQSGAELKTAVNACLKLSSQGDRSEALHGPIGEWDVSRVDDMTLLFYDGDKVTQELYLNLVLEYMPTAVYKYTRDHLWEKKNIPIICVQLLM